MARARGHVRLGTSGWVYDGWRGPFYPEDVPKSRWFSFYAERFRTVEVNNTFYRMPTEKSVLRWRDSAPEGFTFAFKASRYVTHLKRLLDSARPVRDLLDRLAPMGEKLGPVLFQLPPSMKRDDARLRAFLKALPPRDVAYVCEFRHPSWHAPEVFDLLGEHGVGLCLHDLGEATPLEATARTVYVRFHGTEGAYRGAYGRKKLSPWAKRIAEWSRGGRDVYAYFNNDIDAKAPFDAEELARQVERLSGSRVLPQG